MCTLRSGGMSPLAQDHREEAAALTPWLAPSVPQPGAHTPPPPPPPRAKPTADHLLPLLQDQIWACGVEADRNTGTPRMSSRGSSQWGGSLRASVGLAEQRIASYRRP